MNRSSTAFASLAISATLFLGACSAGNDAAATATDRSPWPAET